MSDDKQITKKRGKKFEAEIGADLKTVAEDTAIREKKTYTPEQLCKAIENISLEINNAYFRTPYHRCPDCNKGNNAIMGHFGLDGKNKLGNLKGFQATVGDVIAWSSNTYKGLSIVKAKDNGVFELETSPFHTPRKEPAVIERLVVPEKYRSVIGKMAEYEANKFDAEYEDTELVKIGNGEYPYAIKKEL